MNTYTATSSTGRTITETTKRNVAFVMFATCSAEHHMAQHGQSGPGKVYQTSSRLELAEKAGRVWARLGWTVEVVPAVAA